jgi:hypothetical protein
MLPNWLMAGQPQKNGRTQCISSQEIHEIRSLLLLIKSEWQDDVCVLRGGLKLQLCDLIDEPG